jgi:hypothetical protein
MSYKEKILTHFGPRQIDLTTLIEGIVSIYGKKEASPASILATSSNMYLSESKLDSILIDILTEDGKNMAYMIETDENAKQILKWEYHTKEGDGYISER